MKESLEESRECDKRKGKTNPVEKTETTTKEESQEFMDFKGEVNRSKCDSSVRLCKDWLSR